MPRNYVDNAMNRSLGRVGMPLGSAVHSSGSYSSSSFSARPYVDNSFNQSLGRVGLPVGSAVHSKSPSSSSSSSSARPYVDNAQNRSLGRVGLPVGTAVHSNSPSSSSSSSSSSARAYVDNAQNRSLGRVGLPVGSAVHSSSPSSSSSSSSARAYVDNAQNRSLGRAGLPVGSAVHSSSPSSRSPSSSARSYVDNAQNRSLGRVGLPVGTAVHSKSPSSSSEKRYVNNDMNRHLERVGQPVGTAVQSKITSVEKSKKGSHAGKLYKDNPFNRKHNRVGLPLGSRPIRNVDLPYQDNPINRYLGRVGMPKGSHSVPKGKFALLLAMFKEKEKVMSEDIHDYRSHGNLNEECFIHDYDDEEAEVMDHILENRNRIVEVDKWMEANECHLTPASQMHIEQAESKLLSKYSGEIIRFEDLKLGDKIGHGGFGTVYFAHYQEMVVAVKVLTQAITKKRLKLFEEEILNHSRLQHPNVVKFYGPCLERPNIAIVMEYMDASLWESLHINEDQFTGEDKLQIILDVTEGLKYLHNLPLVHGDLKTRNVLLILPVSCSYDRSEKPIVAKLSDFGLSQLKSDSETSQTAMTTKKTPIGATALYSAPEVLRGERLSLKEGLKTDIYSIGLVIHELVVEEIPFEDFDLAQLCKCIGNEGIKPSPPKGLILAKPLEEMLQLCWSFKPFRRPNATELKEMASNLSSNLISNEREE